MDTSSNLPDSEPRGFIVWQHADGAKAVAHFAERAMADEYAAYCNRTNPVKWYEVRRHWELTEG